MQFLTCYDTRYPNKVGMSKMKCLWMNDTEGEFECKTTAAKKAIEHMMEKYDNEYNGIQNDRHHTMVNEQSTAFFKAVRTYYPLTFHLKASKFEKYKGDIKFHSCPFGQIAQLWCRNHGLRFIEHGKIACQLHTLKCHIVDTRENCM